MQLATEWLSEITLLKTFIIYIINHFERWLLSMTQKLKVKKYRYVFTLDYWEYLIHFNSVKYFDMS